MNIMTRCLWAESIVECLVMCGHTVKQQELDAVTRLLAHQPLHKTDSDWLVHLLRTNPQMKLDDLDIEDFKEFITNNYEVMS